jgi:EamA domain-containing membrane protein RarD
VETKETVQLAKKIILGNNKPAPILRFLCWFTLVWDSIIAIWMTGSGFFFMIKKENFSNNDLLKDFNQEFCFTYAFIHGISLLSAILMYRMKRIGFFIYAAANIAMLVTLFIYIDNFRSDYLIVTFTLLMIGLFATRLKKMN